MKGPRFLTKDRDCVWLLGALITLFVLQPYLSTLSNLGIPVIEWIDSRMLAVIAYSVVLLLGVRSVSTERRHLKISFGLALPALLLNWLTVTLPEPTVSLKTWATLALIAFLAYVGLRLFIYVISTNAVNQDQLAGAISIYFLLGHTWSLIYLLIELRSPGAFSGLAAGGPQDSELMYFSFVTLTTLGYGEITPTILEARVFAALEAVFGVIYIATLVSRLVSLHAPRSR